MAFQYSNSFAQSNGGKLEHWSNIAKGVVEHMTDGAAYASTTLASSFANGFLYGYKDMTTKTLTGARM